MVDNGGNSTIRMCYNRPNGTPWYCSPSILHCFRNYRALAGEHVVQFSWQGQQLSFKAHFASNDVSCICCCICNVRHSRWWVLGEVQVSLNCRRGLVKIRIWLHNPANFSRCRKRNARDIRKSRTFDGILESSSVYDSEGDDVHFNNKIY